MTPRPLRRGDIVILPVVITLLAVTLAACGSSKSSPAVPASAGPIGSPAPPTDSPEPSVDRHGVPELEALLPASVAGVALERLSLGGADFYALGTDATRGQLDAMLKGLGKTIADLSVGDAGDPTGRNVLEVGDFRVAGTQPDQLLSEWVASREAASPQTVSVSNVTIDGRALTKIVDSAHPVGGVVYAYAKGDTLFLVSADDPKFVSAALRQLPTP